jgi:hypothetical protein
MQIHHGLCLLAWKEKCVVVGVAADGKCDLKLQICLLQPIK